MRREGGRRGRGRRPGREEERERGSEERRLRSSVRGEEGRRG